MYPPKQSDSVISTIGSFSGVASLVLAVAGNNLDRLSNLQRWGLAVASAVMLWAFLAGLVFHQFSLQRDAGKRGKAVGTLFVGAWVGGGLLLAVLPFFSFGLPASNTDTLSLWAAGSFASIFTLAALAGTQG
jgi:peptidoglycan/LPS O-acetylase OafA/YrhL